VRVIAIIAAYNERRFIAPCLEHLHRQGVETYLLNNDSTDETQAIAERYLGSGLIAIERWPRHGMHSWLPILRHKAELATRLNADWFIHADPDEVRLPPHSDTTIAEALTEADRDGYNAVDFHEFTFVPPQEDPEHDHVQFAETMRWYYAFLPQSPHRLSAWRRQPQAVDLATSGGHAVQFPGRRAYPVMFKMRHYLILSHAHAVEKWVRRIYDPDQVERGYSRDRAAATPQSIRLPSQAEMRKYIDDDHLDPSDPSPRHLCFS